MRVEVIQLEPLLIKVPEVARLLALSQAKVYELLASGRLPSVRIDSSRRVSLKALNEWIEQQTEQGI